MGDGGASGSADPQDAILNGTRITYLQAGGEKDWRKITRNAVVRALRQFRVPSIATTSAVVLSQSGRTRTSRLCQILAVSRSEWVAKPRPLIAQSRITAPSLPAIETKVEAFVERYNQKRYHESLNKVPPARVYFGRVQTIIKPREWMKRQAIERRRLQRRKLAA
jgi:transposase InsO family protein